jgi:hypothetical protein
MDDIGMHIEIPLPPNTFIDTYSDISEWFSVRYDGMKIAGASDPMSAVAWFGEYPLNPPPDGDAVFADLVASGADHEDAQQVVDHLRERKMVI